MIIFSAWLLDIRLLTELSFQTDRVCFHSVSISAVLYNPAYPTPLYTTYVIIICTECVFFYFIVHVCHILCAVQVRVTQLSVITLAKMRWDVIGPTPMFIRSISVPFVLTIEALHLSFLFRLVSSIQAIMASSAGYIIATSCDDIIEDQ